MDWETTVWPHSKITKHILGLKHVMCMMGGGIIHINQCLERSKPDGYQLSKLIKI